MPCASLSASLLRFNVVEHCLQECTGERSSVERLTAVRLQSMAQREQTRRTMISATTDAPAAHDHQSSLPVCAGRWPPPIVHVTAVAAWMDRQP